MRSGVWAVAILASAAVSASAQQVKTIRLEVEPAREEYRFNPATVSARPGDVLVFKVVSGSPHSIVFRGEGLTREAREALNSALPHRAADLSSPLLTGPGQEYRVIVPPLTPGSYTFFCLPHRAYDMHGELRILNVR